MFNLKVQREIQERAEFLEDMKKLGKRKEYEPMIQTEISQVIWLNFFSYFLALLLKLFLNTEENKRNGNDRQRAHCRTQCDTQHQKELRVSFSFMFFFYYLLNC